MNIHLIFFEIIVIFNYFISTFAKNNYYIVSIQRNKKDQSYDEASSQIQKAIDDLVNDRMNDIYDIIEENKGSYITENESVDEKLKELDNPLLKKRNYSNQRKKFRFINRNRPTNSDKPKNKRSYEMDDTSGDIQYIPFTSELVYHICPISNYYAIRVYLSNDLIEKVKQLPNVIDCQKDILMKEISLNKRDMAGSVSSSVNPDLSNHYNLKVIQKETGWSNVSVQQNYPNDNYFSHLSLISQDQYSSRRIGQYDNNYYYPSSAGKGIDIYLVDRGLQMNLNDFNMYKGTSDERTVTCDVIITNSIQKSPSSEQKNRYCSIDSGYPRHGIMVSAIAGGVEVGVAKKANLHMIATGLNLSDELVAFDYIKTHGRSYKSVISVSRQGWEVYLSSIQDKINEVTKAGFIIIVGAGNNHENVCVKNKEGQVSAYAGYQNIIVVGATENTIQNNISNGYLAADYSNYGSCVDIHAPGEVLYAAAESYGSANTYYYKQSGTSCATPIVAGVAALLMSEHPEIQYNVARMKQALIDLSLKNILSSLGSSDTPNRFINNGKQVVYSLNQHYSGCGRLAGYTSCSNNNCCTKEGLCSSPTNQTLCQLNQGCQPDYGYCLISATTTTTKKATTTRKTTTTTKASTPQTSGVGAITYKTFTFSGADESTNQLYLGASSLSEINPLTLTKNNKYYTWIVNSESSPSYFYLSTGSYGNTGGFSGYCLDLSTTVNDNNYNYLNIVKCDNVRYKFRFEGTTTSSSSSNTLAVYDKNNHPYQINGNAMCLYYSEGNPRLYKCYSGHSRIYWKRVKGTPYVQNPTQVPTTTRTTTRTLTSTRTSSSGKTSSPVSSYITVKFKGTMSSSTYYLGVNELKAQNSFDIYQLKDSRSAIYRTWHITTTSEPSLYYLSEATYGNNGNPSSFCLDLGSYTNSEGYAFLSIVPCTEARHHFKYGGSYAKTIDIYDLNHRPVTDNQGYHLCLYYSMTPRISRCSYANDKTNKNAEHMAWDIYYL